MHILVTRPVEDAEDLKSRLERLGHRVTLAPLVSIELNAIPLTAIEHATALIATSRNALRALAGSPALRLATTLPLFVVGPGTAATALEMGFQDVFEGAGTASDLVPTVIRKWREEGGLFVYLAGDVQAFDLKSALASAGVNIAQVTAYRSVAAETLPEGVISALRSRDIDAVILMSPRTAETWAHLTAALSPPPDLSGLTHLCISQSVADAVSKRLDAKRILTAANPNLEELLALIKRLAPHSKAE